MINLPFYVSDGKMNYLVDSVETAGWQIGKKIKLDLYLTPFTKINSY